MRQAQGGGIHALERLRPGIVSRYHHRLDSSVVEGIHNTIKMIRRRACGYHDRDYFFRKIPSAFPGNAR